MNSSKEIPDALFASQQAAFMQSIKNPQQNERYLKGKKGIIRPENHSVSFFIGRETKKLNKMLVTLTAMNIHRQTLEKLFTLETLSSRDPIRRIAM